MDILIHIKYLFKKIGVGSQALKIFWKFFFNRPIKSFMARSYLTALGRENAKEFYIIIIVSKLYHIFHAIFFIFLCIPKYC